MSRGKYAARAALHKDEQADTTIEALRRELDERDTVIGELQQDNQRIAPLQTALAQAVEQAEQVTNPEVERLRSKNRDLQAVVDELDRNRPHRERIFKTARDLLMKHEGMTAWEAAEAVTQSETDTIMVESEAQKKLPAKIVKAIQRARGLRNA